MVTPLGWVAVAAALGVVVALAVNVIITREPAGFIARSSISVAAVVGAAGVASLVVWAVGLA